MRAVCAPKCLEKDAHADFLCLHCYPNAVGDNTWAYFRVKARNVLSGVVIIIWRYIYLHVANSYGKM